MDIWIRWALFAPMVTLGSRLCGWILISAFISYGLAYFSLYPRGHLRRGVAIGAGLLSAPAALSLITLAAGPIAQQLTVMDQLATLVFIISGLAALVLRLRREDPRSTSGRGLMLSWDYIFGGFYALGVMSCGPIFATVSASAHLEGWAGLAQLAAYALGLLAAAFLLFIIAASAQRLLARRLELRHLRLLGALGLLAAGALRY